MAEHFLQKFLDRFCDGIGVFEGPEEGSTVTIVAFTHGDEIAGIHVFDYLINTYHLEQHLKKGKVQLIIGNIEAAKLKKRLVEKDFNRVWDFRADSSHTYEYKRAKEIADHLLQSDVVLDLHSTSNPSQPMILPFGAHSLPLELRAQLHSEYVIYDILPLLHGKALVSFISEQKPSTACFAIESGQHTELATLENAVQNSLHVLGHYGLIPVSNSLAQKKQHLQVFKAIHAKNMEVKFLYSDKPKSFDTVAAGKPIVFDGVETIYADEDSVIIMPSMPKYIGEEIGYLAKAAL